MEKDTKFNGTAEERLEWIKKRIDELYNMMNDNLLVREIPGDENSDYMWLDYKDEEEGVSTFEFLNEIDKFFLIVKHDIAPDYFD